MDMTGGKAIIINCGVSNWYGAGSRRLAKSLNFVGWGGETIIYDGYYPENCPSHEDVPYYMKIAVFEEAIQRGFTHIFGLIRLFGRCKTPERCLI